MGLFHVNIYRLYLVLVFLPVCDHQKLRFFNSNNNTAIIALATTTTANSNTSNNKETIIYCFLENHASIVVINLLGFFVKIKLWANILFLSAKTDTNSYAPLLPLSSFPALL